MNDIWWYDTNEEISGKRLLFPKFFGDVYFEKHVEGGSWISITVIDGEKAVKNHDSEEVAMAEVEWRFRDYFEYLERRVELYFSHRQGN